MPRSLISTTFRPIVQRLTPEAQLHPRKMREISHVSSPGLIRRYIRGLQVFDCLPTRSTVPNGLLKELQEVEPVALPERDVRAGKPLLGGLLKFDIARAAARVGTLGALDLLG